MWVVCCCMGHIYVNFFMLFFFLFFYFYFFFLFVCVCVIYTNQLPSHVTRATLASLRLSVVSWATLERHVPHTGQGLVKGQAKSGWTMYTVLGVSSPWPRATSMVGESITVLTERMPGSSVQVCRWRTDLLPLWTKSTFFLLLFIPYYLYFICLPLLFLL